MHIALKVVEFKAANYFSETLFKLHKTKHHKVVGVLLPIATDVSIVNWDNID